MRRNRGHIVEEMHQRGRGRAFGMRCLHRLFKLLRIADQHEPWCSMANREHIRQRGLPGFVDEQDVDRRTKFGA